MLRKDVKSQLFSTGMLISLLLGLVLLVEPQYQYFLYFARWDNKADYINFFLLVPRARRISYLYADNNRYARRVPFLR